MKSKFKTGDRVKVRHDNKEGFGIIKDVLYISLSSDAPATLKYTYSISILPNQPITKSAGYFEEDITFPFKAFSPKKIYSMGMPLPELLLYYKADSDQRRETPTLTGWISYWRKTVKEDKFAITYPKRK